MPSKICINKCRNKTIRIFINCNDFVKRLHFNWNKMRLRFIVVVLRIAQNIS